MVVADYDNLKTTEGSVVKKIASLVVDMDTRLSNILNQVLHDENFQRLESSWRGLFHLVARAETGTSLKFQRKVAQAVKRARHIGLLPYVTDSLK